MSFRELYEKEKRVVLYGQSARFRIGKYIILLLFLGLLYGWKDLKTTLSVLGVLLVASLIVHLFYRWMTKGWTQSWGGFAPKS